MTTDAHPDAVRLLVEERWAALATLDGDGAPLASMVAFACAPGREAYLARFPDAEMRFELPDFLLLNLEITSARWVGGFARAQRLDPDRLRQAARELQGLSGTPSA